MKDEKDRRKRRSCVCCLLHPSSLVSATDVLAALAREEAGFAGTGRGEQVSSSRRCGNSRSGTFQERRESVDTSVPRLCQPCGRNPRLGQHYGSHGWHSRGTGSSTWMPSTRGHSKKCRSRG